MIIAISGKSGCGNSTVCKTLAHRFNLTLINYTFREYAEENGLQFEDVHALAAKDGAIDRQIDQRQITLARKGNCIIGSRLAIWNIPNPTLKIYLSAPLTIRAKRIAQREHKHYVRALVLTYLRDHRDINRFKRIYDIDINNYHIADLIIDTSNKNIDKIVEIISNKVKILYRSR